MRHNDIGFITELSEEMGITQSEAERIVMTQGLGQLNELCQEDDIAQRKGVHIEMSVDKPVFNTGAAEEKENGAVAASNNNGDKLWTTSYVSDIVINFLMYVVHLQLMLWSTSYAINSWGVSISTAGAASGLFVVGSLLARLPAGRYIDLIGRRKLFLGGTAFYFLVVLLYLMCPNVYAFMLVRLLHGVSFGCASTAASTIVAALVPIHRMGAGIGYYTLGVTMASAVGPFLALTFINAGDFTMSITFCTVLSLVIFVLSCLIKVPERTLTEREVEQFHTFSWKDFIAKNSLGISLVAFIGGICYSTVLSYLGEYSAAKGMAELGGQLFFIAFAATSFLSRPLTGWLLDHRGGNVVLYPSLIMLVLSMVAIALANNDYVLLLGGLLLGAGYGSITSACHALAVHCALSRQIGVATSTYFVLLDFGTGVGPYCMGSLVPGFGFEAVYVCAAIVSIVGFVAYFLSMGRFHRFSSSRMDRERQIKANAAMRRAATSAE